MIKLTFYFYWPFQKRHGPVCAVGPFWENRVEVFLYENSMNIYEWNRPETRKEEKALYCTQICIRVCICKCIMYLYMYNEYVFVYVMYMVSLVPISSLKSSLTLALWRRVTHCSLIEESGMLHTSLCMCYSMYKVNISSSFLKFSFRIDGKSRRNASLVLYF